MNKIKQAPTKELKRSEINFATYNPRKITEKAKGLLKANLKKHGLMGGIVLNLTTGNLVSGHQKLGLIDQVEGYPENDYQIRVEVVELSEKEEKEQNLFLNNQNAQGEFDAALVKQMIGEIDYKAAGIDEIDLNMMGITLDTKAASAIDEINADFADLSAPLEEKKAAVKEAKQAVKVAAQQKAKDQTSYIVLSFDNDQNKVAFLARAGMSANEQYIKGEDFEQLIEFLNDEEN